MNYFWAYVLGTVLLLLVAYLFIRLGSSAFFKSKKEFLEWYHKQPNYDRRKGD